MKKNKNNITTFIEKKRQLTGWYSKIAAFVAITMSLYQIWGSTFALIPQIERNSLHLLFLLTLAFFYFPISSRIRSNKIPFYDLIFVAIGVSSTLYLFFRYRIFSEAGAIANNWDYFFAAIIIILILELSRRVIGISIPIISIIFLLYALYGSYVPGVLKFRGVSLTRLLYRMYLSSEGIWGITMNISATYLFLFILFSSFLEISGAAKNFNNIAFALAGKMKGGPAQVAVIGSGLMGSISGSSVANVATTGSFTIPLMKKVGYKPSFAGAVEAAASSGGMIMPPVMGTVAFIMAAFLNTSYIHIIKAALLPALLYYFSLSVMVNLQASKQNLKNTSIENIPKIGDVLIKSLHSLLPLASIVIVLLIGRTAIYAAFVGILVAIVTSWARKETRMGIKDILKALETGAKNAIPVCIACTCCGLIVGVTSITGIGSVIALNIFKLSLGMPILALLLIAISSIIISAALPSSALYIIVSVTCVPALLSLGFSRIGSHFFVLWMGVMSNLTPPLAMASYAASALAGSPLRETALKGLKLASAGFIIPFMAIYNPVILMEGATIWSYGKAIVLGLIGIFSLAVSIQGFLKNRLSFTKRISFLASAVLLIFPGQFTYLIGLVLLGLTLRISLK